MTTRYFLPLTAASLALLAGCAQIPSGPSVMALPGSGKNFEQFRADDVDCRNYAQYQINGSPASAQTASGLTSAAVGTVVGAVAGAAIGGNHNAAGVGAGTGLMVGSMAGVGAAQQSATSLQRQYDHAYIQCMYGKGHSVPVPGGYGGSGYYRSNPSYAPQPYNQPAPALPAPPPGY